MRVTIWDLETTDLQANFGRLLCCSFVDLGSDDVETFSRSKAKYKSGKWADNDDGKLATAIRNRLEKADIIVGWNSILYDQPFLNTRLQATDERPLHVGQSYGSTHLDLMYYAGGQMMRAGGRRLETIAKFFNLAHQKTPLTPETWSKAAAGNTAALLEVEEHCEADVRVTRDVFWKLAPHIKKIQFTLADVYPWLLEIPGRSET